MAALSLTPEGSEKAVQLVSGPKANILWMKTDQTSTDALFAPAFEKQVKQFAKLVTQVTFKA